MTVEFDDKDLENLAIDDKKRLRKMGKIRADKFAKRINQFIKAQTLQDTKGLPGNFHELSGDRKGQWACDLDQPYRLIFVPMEDPIPIDKNGSYIWSEISGVVIIGIEDYH